MEPESWVTDPVITPQSNDVMIADVPRLEGQSQTGVIRFAPGRMGISSWVSNASSRGEVNARPETYVFKTTRTLVC